MAEIFQSKAPSAQKVLSKSYRSFRGADLTTAITEIDDSRSPYAPNMISDESGFPCKRTGWLLFDNLGGRINGVHTYITPDGDKELIIHAGDKLYKYQNGEKELLREGLADDRSTSFMYDGKFYLLDGKRFLRYDGSQTVPVDENGYIPTTAISMPPEGGGEDYEAVNLLSPYRKNEFLSKAGSVNFQLDATNIEEITKAEIKNSSGVWVETTSYSVNLTTGVVTFATSPGAPAVTGEDNVRITFKKTVPGYADRINKCRICASYGIGSDNRIFIAGNPNNRNYDYYCNSGDAEYFSDINYCIVGSDMGAIMGYLHQYDSLVIVKEKNDKDACIFIRSANLNDKNEAQFIVRQGISGVGAVSMYAFANLADDNMFLSDAGVMGLDTSAVTMQRTVQNRSYYVNVALEKELLKNSVACVNGRYFYLFTGKNVYIADSYRRNENNSRSFGYEWFYFTDIPARSCAVFEDVLYFGDTDGNLYKFKTEEEYGMAAFSDENSLTGEKQPIFAAWATKLDRLSDAAMFKKIKKTGTGIVTKPFADTSGTICYVTSDEEAVKEYELTTVFDFDDVDFDNFNFGELPNPYFVPARKKKRKAKMWQMIVKNDKTDSAFGLYEVRVNYSMGTYIKR